MHVKRGANRKLQLLEEFTLQCEDLVAYLVLRQQSCPFTAIHLYCSKQLKDHVLGVDHFKQI